MNLRSLFYNNFPFPLSDPAHVYVSMQFTTPVGKNIWCKGYSIQMRIFLETMWSWEKVEERRVGVELHRFSPCVLFTSSPSTVHFMRQFVNWPSLFSGLFACVHCAALLVFLPATAECGQQRRRKIQRNQQGRLFSRSSKIIHIDLGKRTTAYGVQYKTNNYRPMNKKYLAYLANIIGWQQFNAEFSLWLLWTNLDKSEQGCSVLSLLHGGQEGRNPGFPCRG